MPGPVRSASKSSKRVVMTSSESAPGSADGAATPRRSVTVLAEGHLHPGMLFLRFVDGLRQSILPVLVAFFAGQAWLAIASLVLLVLSLVHAVIRFVTFRYRLTTEELVTTEGIFERQERRIPVDRIQDLGFESTVLRRLFGLVVVSVETASGQGAEARLDSLSRRHAEHLRSVLHALRGRTGPAVDQAPSGILLHRASVGELVLLGLSNNRLGAILLGLVGAFELLDQVGLGERFGSFAGGVAQNLADAGSLMFALLALGGMFVALLGGWAVSVVGSLVLYHGFRLTERDEVFQRRYGLLTTRVQNLPRRKVQRVLLEAAPLRRLFGVVVVRADSAGSSSTDGAGEAGGSRDVLVPLCARATANRLLPRLLEGLPSRPLRWRRVSRKIVSRMTMRGVLLAVPMAAVTWPLFGGAVASSAVLLPIMTFGLGLAAYANQGYALLPAHVAVRFGVLARHQAYVPFRKVQGVVLRAGPIERRLGIARLVFFVAGGSPTVLAYLPRETADRLARDLANAAARSRFEW